MIGKITDKLASMSNRQIAVTVIFYVVILVLIIIIANKGGKWLKEIVFKLRNPARSTDGSVTVDEARKPFLDSVAANFQEWIYCWFCDKSGLAQACIDFASMTDAEAIYTAKKYKAVVGNSLYDDLMGETDWSLWSSSIKSSYNAAMTKLAQINMAN